MDCIAFLSAKPFSALLEGGKTIIFCKFGSETEYLYVELLVHKLQKILGDTLIYPLQAHGGKYFTLGVSDPPHHHHHHYHHPKKTFFLIKLSEAFFS